MTDISARRRRAGRWALGLSAAFALPLTATVVYAGQDAPEPPAAPVTPVAPVAPVAPKVEKRVTIIEHRDHAGHRDHADAAGKAKFEKRLERGGKTVVIRSDEPIDEAELEASLAKVDKLDKLKTKWDGAAIERKLREKRVVRSIVTHSDDDEGHEGHRVTMISGKCEGEATLAEADASRESGDAKHKSVSRTHVLVCGEPGHSLAEALAKVRTTRDSIAASESMSPEIRADVLRQLESALARLENDGE